MLYPVVAARLPGWSSVLGTLLRRVGTPRWREPQMALIRTMGACTGHCNMLRWPHCKTALHVRNRAERRAHVTALLQRSWPKKPHSSGQACTQQPSRMCAPRCV